MPTAGHAIKGITHYGIYREGFKEATDLELAWFDKHLKGMLTRGPVAAIRRSRAR